MQTIGEIAQAICRAGAAAMRRYTEVSGQDAYLEMPEHFLQAYVFDHLGDKDYLGNNITMTLETNFSKLSDWDRQAVLESPLASNNDLDPNVTTVAENLGIPRVDLVVYERQFDNQPKEDQGMLALVEFKKSASAIEIDLQKLLKILPSIRTCQYGIVAGACEEGEVNTYKADCERAGNDWFECSVEKHTNMRKHTTFVARVFKNTASHASSPQT